MTFFIKSWLKQGKYASLLLHLRWRRLLLTVLSTIAPGGYSQSTGRGSCPDRVRLVFCSKLSINRSLISALPYSKQVVMKCEVSWFAGWYTLGFDDVGKNCKKGGYKSNMRTICNQPVAQLSNHAQSSLLFNHYVSEQELDH